MRFLASFLVAGLGWWSFAQAAPMANEITDLAYFPEQGRVQMSLQGGWSASTGELDDAGQIRKSGVAGLGSHLEALYSMNNWVAMGLNVQFDTFSQNSQVGATAKKDIFKSMNAVPSLVVAASALGAESDLPFAVNGRIGFAPKWVKFAAPQKAGTTPATGTATLQKVERKNQPQTHDLNVGLVMSYKMHSMIQMALEGGYTKIFISEDDRAKAQREWASVNGGATDHLDSRNQFVRPDVINAALRVQTSIMDKAYVVAGAEYKWANFLGAKQPQTGTKVSRLTQNDFSVGLTIKAPVHEQVAIQAGGSYLIKRSAKLNNALLAQERNLITPDLENTKTLRWGVNAGLVALF